MVENLLRSLEEFQRDINALSQLASRSGSTFSAIEARAAARAEVENKRELEKKKQNEEAAEGLKQLSSGVVSFSKTMTSGQTGMVKYAASLTSMIEGVGKSAKFLGLLGGPITLVAGAIASLVSGVLKQNTTILESYDTLAQIGVSAGITASELDKIVANSQGNLDFMPSFIAGMKKLGQNVMVLGHSTAEGTRKFAEITTISPEIRNQFRNLGLSQEKVNELQADYIAQFGFQDQLKNKDAAAIRNASLKWIKETMALTAVTGMTRDQQVSANEALKNDVAYQAMLGQATETQRKSVEPIAQMFETITPGFGREVTRQILSGHNISGELSQMLAVSGFTPKHFDELRAASKKGPEETMVVFQTAMKSVNEVLQSNLMKNNLSQHEYAEKMNINQQLIEMVRRFANSKPYDAVKADIENQAKTGDELLDMRNKVTTAENKLKSVFQELIRLISGPINTAFTWVAETVTNFIEAIMDSKLYRFITGAKQDNTGKRYTSASSSADAEKKLNKLVELEKKSADDLATMTNSDGEMYVEGKPIYSQADIAAKQKELDEIKKNRLQAENNLDKLKQLEQEQADIANPRPGQPGGPEGPPEPATNKKAAPAPAAKAPAPAQAAPAPAPEKKVPRIQAPVDPKTLLPQQPPPITINVAPAPKEAPKPAPAPAEQKEAAAQPKKVNESRKLASGGVTTGPESGYDAVLHGVEAVIPLPNNRSIPVSISVSSEFEEILDTVRDQGAMMKSTVQALNKNYQLDFASLLETLSSELETDDDLTQPANQPIQSVNGSKAELDPAIVKKIDKLIESFSLILDRMRDNKAAHEMILQEVKRA